MQVPTPDDNVCTSARPQFRQDAVYQRCAYLEIESELLKVFHGITKLDRYSIFQVFLVFLVFQVFQATTFFLLRVTAVKEEATAGVKVLSFLYFTVIM